MLPRLGPVLASLGLEAFEAGRREEQRRIAARFVRRILTPENDRGFQDPD